MHNVCSMHEHCMCSKVLASLIMLNACWLLSLRLAVLRVPHLKKGPAVEKRFGKATRERACYIPGDAPAPDCCQRCFLAFFGTSGSSEHMFLTSFTGAVLSMARPKAEGRRPTTAPTGYHPQRCHCSMRSSGKVGTRSGVRG